MKYLDLQNKDVMPVRRFFRCLAALLCFFGLLASLGAIYFSTTEPFEPLLVLLAILFTLVTYSAGKVATTGYPPRVLLWTSEERVE